MNEQILLGKWTEETLRDLLAESSKIGDHGKRIEFLSGQFVETPYKKSTLIGDRDTPEIFVINLEGVDCFTFLDYIEAMRISKNFTAFKDNLKKIRYQSGDIAFEKRNHFFSDWCDSNANLVDDVTVDVGKRKSRFGDKILNKNDDGTFFLPGVPCKRRRVAYIPNESIDEKTSAQLKTGDYVGIYSENPGLDVTHVGIIIRDGKYFLFRHASSSSDKRKVIDESFKGYIKNKPGIIILRPK